MVQFGAVVFVLAFWYLVVYLICTDFAQVPRRPGLSALNSKPWALNIHSSTLGMRPLAFDPQPQPPTLNPQPSTSNPQLATLDPQPATRNPQPSTLNPQPSHINP